MYFIALPALIKIISWNSLVTQDDIELMILLPSSQWWGHLNGDITPGFKSRFVV